MYVDLVLGIWEVDNCLGSHEAGNHCEEVGKAGNLEAQVADNRWQGIEVVGNP